MLASTGKLVCTEHVFTALAANCLYLYPTLSLRISSFVWDKIEMETVKDIAVEMQVVTTLYFFQVR